jgi:hypothetical protein
MTQEPDGFIHATRSCAHHVMLDGLKTSVTDIYYTSFAEHWVMEKPFFHVPWE